MSKYSNYFDCKNLNHPSVYLPAAQVETRNWPHMNDNSTKKPKEEQRVVKIWCMIICYNGCDNMIRCRASHFRWVGRHLIIR